MLFFTAGLFYAFVSPKAAFAGYCPANWKEENWSYGPVCLYQSPTAPTPKPDCPNGTYFERDDTEKWDYATNSMIPYFQRVCRVGSSSGHKTSHKKEKVKKISPLTHTKGKLTSSIGITPASPLYSTASAMEGVCAKLYAKKTVKPLTAGEAALFQNCVNIMSENQIAPKVKGVQQISPVVLKSQQLTIKQTGTFYLGSIAGHLLAMRESSQESQKDTAMRHKTLPHLYSQQKTGNLLSKITLPEVGGAAGDFEEEERRGFFVNATGSTGERNPSEATEGYEYNGFNLAVGGDYLLDSGTVVGGAVGFGSTSSELNNNGGTLDTDITMLSLYAMRNLSGFFLDGIIGFGMGNYENDRRQDFSINGRDLHHTLKGDTDGPIFFTSLGGGKGLSTGNLDIDISGRMNYLRAEIDGYSEGSPDPLGAGLALEIDDQGVTSLTSELTIGVSCPISFAFGVMQPEISSSYIHEFNKDGDDIRARFLNDSFSEGFVQTSADFGNTIPTIFTVPGEKMDADYANLGMGLNFVLPHSQRVMLNATTMLFYEDYNHWYYSVGYRKDF